MYVCMYIYIYITYIYIYIYRERERERDMSLSLYIYIYIYTCVCYNVTNHSNVNYVFLAGPLGVDGGVQAGAGEDLKRDFRCFNKWVLVKVVSSKCGCQVSGTSGHARPMFP